MLYGGLIEGQGLDLNQSGIAGLHAPFRLGACSAYPIWYVCAKCGPAPIFLEVIDRNWVRMPAVILGSGHVRATK